MSRLRGKLSYSNVMVTVLAVLVLGGGSAYAATQMLPRGSVGTKQLEKEAVTPAKLSKASKAALAGPQGATGAQGPKGDAGPQGSKGDTGIQGPAGFVRGFEARAGVSPAAKLGTSLFGTNVLTLSVPVGTYLVTTNIEFTAFGGTGTAICRLINGVGGPGSDAISREQSLAMGSPESVTISAIYTVTSGQEMEVQCSHGSSDTAPTVHVDDINIVAVPVAEGVRTIE